MSDDDFLHGIMENPEDDTLRLVYADWLEERGDPRGELIRVQCAIAAMKREKDQGWGPLRSRERKLLKQHLKIWLGNELHALVTRDAASRSAWTRHWQCDRGLFLVNLKAEEFLRLSQSSPFEAWKWVTSLAIRDLKAASTEEFAASPLLTRLQCINLHSSKIGATGMAAFSSSPNLTSLASLELAHNQIGLEGVASLVRARSLARLKKLNLYGNQIGDAGVALLLAWPQLKKLRELSLSGNEISETGVATLAGSPHLRELQLLDLCHNDGVRDDGAMCLADSRHLSGLNCLRISANNLREDTMAQLRKRFGRGLQAYRW